MNPLLRRLERLESVISPCAMRLVDLIDAGAVDERDFERAARAATNAELDEAINRLRERIANA